MNKYSTEEEIMFYDIYSENHNFVMLAIIDAVYCSLDNLENKNMYNRNDITDMCNFTYNVWIKDEGEARDFGYYADCVVNGWKHIKEKNLGARAFLCEIYEYEV